MNAKNAPYQPTIHLMENLTAEVSPDADFSYRFMFGGVGFYSRGRMFAGMINPHTLLLKLPADQCETLLKIGSAEPDYPAETPMGQHYTVLPRAIKNDPDKLIAWVKRSMQYVWGLPAPKSKSKK